MIFNIYYIKYDKMIQNVKIKSLDSEPSVGKNLTIMRRHPNYRRTGVSEPVNVPYIDGKFFFPSISVGVTVYVW